MWRSWLTITIALPFVLGGCGGGGSSGGAAPSTASPPPPPPPVASPPPPPPPNRDPVLVADLPDQQAVADHPYSYRADQAAAHFTDPDGDNLSFSISGFFVTRSQGLSKNASEVFGTPTRGFVEIMVSADDGRGGSTSASFGVNIRTNTPPVVENPNLAYLTTPGAEIDYDATQQGETFEEIDGDPLTYVVRFESDPRGLAIEGTRITGQLLDIGVVRVAITAFDGFGGHTEDEFAIALPAPDPGTVPILPVPSYVYDDFAADLPARFLRSHTNGIPFWDTTPPDNRVTNAGATLGRVLFYDKRLSITNTKSCASCHRQELGFADSTAFSVGVLDVPTSRNAMALANVRYSIMDFFFSDSRVETLEALATMPIENPGELGSPLPFVEQKLERIAYYPLLFEAAFGTPEITSDRIARALAQFLRSMISYRSKFDAAHYSPDLAVPEPNDTYTAQEKLGALVFRSNSCRSCHVDTIQVMDFDTNNGLDRIPTDQGAGHGVFRSASLRNIALSGPYMHDGRFTSLREVIDHYDHGIQDTPALDERLRDRDTGLPRRLNLSEEEKDALEAFLHTLTDEPFLTDPRLSDPFR